MLKYLYAQWQANKYTVSYNANGGQGDLPATDALYGADFALPDAGVSRADHLLLGWAREPGAAQPDYFPGQTVRDLTAEADGAVTLYAVWLSNAEIQQGYLDQLAALGQRYAQSDYYPEDWQTITAALADTPASSQRARQVAAGWEQAHQAVLSRLDAPVPLDQRAICDVEAAAALADAEALEKYSGLGASAADAATAGRALLAGRLEQAEPWAGSAPGQVTSADAPALEQLEEQLDALDAAAAFYCDPAATAAVRGFARLAADKKAALAELEGFYADMLAAWQYSPEGRALLEEKKQATAAGIEAADASGRVSALLVAGKADLGLVDPLPKAPVITAWPTAASIVRGQALADSALTGGSADVEGTFAWKEPDARPAASGDYTVVFTPADARRYQTVALPLWRLKGVTAPAAPSGRRASAPRSGWCCGPPPSPGCCSPALCCCWGRGNSSPRR